MLAGVHERVGWKLNGDGVEAALVQWDLGVHKTPERVDDRRRGDGSRGVYVA